MSALPPKVDIGAVMGMSAIGQHVEGEVHASIVQIGDGAQVEGDIVAEELTIGGRVKGTIHANRVKLNSTAVVEGDIYHRSLAIEGAIRGRVTTTGECHRYAVARPREALTGTGHQRQRTGQRCIGQSQSISDAGRVDRPQGAWQHYV